jgi:hypothetical protein
MNFGTAVKPARGGFSAEEAVELACTMGWYPRYQDLMDGERSPAFQRAAGIGVQVGSKATAISGNVGRPRRRLCQTSKSP